MGGFCPDNLLALITPAAYFRWSIPGLINIQLLQPDIGSTDALQENYMTFQPAHSGMLIMLLALASVALGSEPGAPPTAEKSTEDRLKGVYSPPTAGY